jgi:large subunit ribosomal protein L19
MSETKQEVQYKPGMVVRVFQKIKETNAKGEEKDRLQAFEGIILAAKHGTEIGATITVQKEVDGIGVQRIFPIHSPVIDHIEIVREFVARRAKLNHLRIRSPFDFSQFMLPFKRKLKEVKKPTAKK